MATPTTQATAIPPLSQSRYELMACPHLYRERVILGRKEPDNPYAMRGTEIHSAIANYVHHLVETRQPSDYEVFTSVCRGLSEEAVEVLESMREWLIIEPETVLGTEMYLALDEQLEPIIPLDGQDLILVAPNFEGTLDYVQLTKADEAEIFDWKSYYQVIDADTFQAKLYPLLVFKHYPTIRVVRFILQFVRYGVQRSIEYTRDDLPKLEKAAKLARTRQQELHSTQGMVITKAGLMVPAAAMPGRHCAWCPKLMGNCPIREINPYTNQSVEDRVKFGVWLQAAKKQNDQVLKDLVMAQGPVKVRDDNGNAYEADFMLTEKSSYPASVLPIVAEMDPALIEKLTIGGLSSPLKAKKRAPLAEALAPHIRSTPQTRFGIRGTDEDEEAE